MPEPNRDISDAIQRLEEEIVLGRLHPRERLTEDDLIRRFSLNRYAVRQVLAELANRGLLTRRRNVGSEVRSFTRKEVVELYEIRILLEGEAARRLPCPMPEEPLQVLRKIQRQHDVAVRDNDLRSVFRSNQKFHQALFSLCENSTLQEAIQEYARRTHPIRFGSLVHPRYRERSRGEHWAMLEALAEGRRDDLVRLCIDHLIPSRDAYLELNPDLV